MQSDPRPWISALRNSHDRLSALVAPLVPDGVQAPSLASEWSVAQVLSHLGSQAEIFGALLDATVAGVELPGQDAFPPIWDAWNSRSPVEQVVDSVAANEAFVAKVEALPDARLDTLEFAAFGMNLDMAGFLRLRLSEHAVHTWDVAASLDPAAVLSSDAVELGLDSLPEMARRIGKAQDKPIRIRVVTSDPARDLVLTADDAVAIDGWDGESTGAVLRLPAEAWMRLVYGRLDDKHAVAVEFEGDGLTLDSVRSVFPGF